MRRTVRFIKFCVALQVGLVATALTACGPAAGDRAATADTSTPALRTDAAAVCDPRRAWPLLLQLPAAGGYRLNLVPMDSARLAAWFGAQLARRPPEGRMIFVGLDSTRRGELRWIVPAIERAGGAAYAPDSACLPPVRAPSGAPAV